MPSGASTVVRAAAALLPGTGRTELSGPVEVAVVDGVIDDVQGRPGHAWLSHAVRPAISGAVRAAR